MIEFYNSSSLARPLTSLSGSLNGSSFRINSKYLAIRFFTNEAITTSGWNITVAKIVDGSWSEWYGPSICSGTCFPFSQGTLTKVRYCSNPAPSNGGSDCVGSNIAVDTCTPVCKNVVINLLPSRIVFDYPQDYSSGLNSQWTIVANHSAISGFILTFDAGNSLVSYVFDFYLH